MAIDHDGEGMIIECDECGEESTEYGDWQSCIETFKNDGWWIRKVEDEWLHFCSRECFNNNRGLKNE